MNPEQLVQVIEGGLSDSYTKWPDQPLDFERVERLLYGGKHDTRTFKYDRMMQDTQIEEARLNGCCGKKSNYDFSTSTPLQRALAGAGTTDPCG